jgi:hypothetical protein
VYDGYGPYGPYGPYGISAEWVPSMYIDGAYPTIPIIDGAEVCDRDGKCMSVGGLISTP